MSRRRLSDDQMERIAIMREGGASYGEIAKAIANDGRPISPGAISWHCLRMGAYPPESYRSRWTGTEHKCRVYSRDGVKVRSFTAEEDSLLLHLESQGLKYGAIAKRMNRSRSSIQGRLLTLARRDDLAEAA